MHDKGAYSDTGDYEEGKMCATNRRMHTVHEVVIAALGLIFVTVKASLRNVLLICPWAGKGISPAFFEQGCVGKSSVQPS